jgi:hypothetical protein
MAAKKQGVLAAVGGLTLVAAIVLIASNIRLESEAGQDSRLRTLIDSKTGAVFPDFRVSEEQQPPYLNPKTGERTLYPAEACYWNRDGTAKITPTMVFLREWTEPGAETICPDCGRRVTRHNPMPPAEALEEAAKREGKL